MQQRHPGPHYRLVEVTYIQLTTVVLGMILFIVVIITTIIATIGHVNTIVTAPTPTAGTTATTKIQKSNTEDTIHQLLNQVRTWQQSHYHHDPNFTPQSQQDDEEYCNYRTQSAPARPFITATFAQSVDGFMSPFMAHAESDNTTFQKAERPTTLRNYPLSSHESLVLTHGLRSIHDGILIGGRTLLLDNPRLTNRLWGIAANHNSNNIQIEKVSNNETANRILSQNQLETHQPQPIIIDPKLRYIQQLLQETNGTMNLRHPIVCCTLDAASSIQLHRHQYYRDNHDDYFRHNITQNTIRLLPCACNSDSSHEDDTTSTLNMTNVLHQLYHRYHLRSIMVEGGAYTLSTLFATTTTSSVLVDAIVITIAPQLLCSGIRPTFRPTVIGHDSCSSTSIAKNAIHVDAKHLKLSSSTFVVIGNDATLIARCK